MATLAHELFWTCDCSEAPRRCAADSRHLCPFIRTGMFRLPGLDVLACRYPFHGKLRSLNVAYDERSLWVWLVGFNALVAFPRADIRLG